MKGPPIVSGDNRRVKLAASLRRPNACIEHGAFLVEGPRFLDGAGDTLPLFVLVSTEATPEAGAAGERAEASGAKVLKVEPGVFAKVSSTRTPQGVAAVFPLPAWTEEDVFRGGTVAALDGVSDPGNAGTVMRSAAAFGGGAVFLPGSAYPYGPKATRASAGANIRLPVITAGALSDLVSRHPDYIFAGTDPRGTPLSGFRPDRPVCLVVGSEARGLSRDSADAVACLLSIPMGGGVESLNAGVSASLILYHLREILGTRRLGRNKESTSEPKTFSLTRKA